MDAEQRRLADRGYGTIDARDATCCYARQDQFWVDNTPDGEQWAVYTVPADSDTYGQDSVACC